MPRKKRHTQVFFILPNAYNSHSRLNCILYLLHGVDGEEE